MRTATATLLPSCYLTQASLACAPLMRLMRLMLRVSAAPGPVLLHLA